jgi:hypothetical protein
MKSLKARLLFLFKTISKVEGVDYVPFSNLILCASPNPTIGTRDPPNVSCTKWGQIWVKGGMDLEKSGAWCWASFGT